VAEVVGVGILLTPAAMMRALGGIVAPMILWLVMGALTAAGALCYAELSTRFPQTGGTYVFLREGFGRRTAFAYGWMAMLVMDPGLTAALAIGTSKYLLAAAGISSRFEVPVAIAAIVVLAAIALRGLASGAVLLRWSAMIKLGMVALLVVAGVAKALGGATPMPHVAASAVSLPALAGAVVSAFFAFGGWWDLGRLSEEVEQPERSLPVAMIAGVGLVALIYVLVTFTLLLAAPPASAATDDAFVAAAGAVLFGQRAGRLLAVMVTLAVSGSLFAVLLGAPRISVAMARDGLLPSRVTWFDEARGRAVPGTLLQAGLASALVVIGSFDQILGYFVPAAVFFLGLSAATLFTIDRGETNRSAFLVPLFPLPLVLFLLLIVIMLVLFAVGQPTQTSLGAVVVLLGWLYGRRMSTDSAAREISE